MKLRTARAVKRWVSVALAMGSIVVWAAAYGEPAAPAHAAEGTVAKTIEAALKVLRDPAWQGPDKRGARVEKLRSVADSAFDWEEMSKRSLGVHWRSIDAAQRKRFVEVFSDLLAEHYMNDIDRFRGTEVIEVLGSEARGQDHEVKTHLTTHSGEKIPIHYVMHRKGESWHVYDAIIEGVSLVNHYRTGFNRQLANRTFDALLDQLSRRRDSLRAQR